MFNHLEEKLSMTTIPLIAESFCTNGEPFPFKFEVIPAKKRRDTAEVHRHSIYEIMLFEKGGGHHLIDFENIPITDYTMHFISPGQVHQLDRDPDSSGWVILFSDEFFYFNQHNKDLLFELPFFHHKTSRPVLNLTKEHFEEIQTLFFTLQEEFHSNRKYRLNLLQSYIHILLLRGKELFEGKQDIAPRNDNAYARIIYNFKNLIEKHFLKLHQVNDYAAILNITPNHLNGVCKTVLGKNASELIKDRIALEAKRLLIFSGMNIKEISFALNFEDPSLFTRFFKNQNGTTPYDFQRQTRVMYQY